MTASSTILWLVDEDSNPGCRQERLASAARAAGFDVRTAHDSADAPALPPDTAVVVGHSINLGTAFLRASTVPVVHYSGGKVPPIPEGEYRVVRPLDRGRAPDLKAPNLDEWVALREWVSGERTSTPPDWIVSPPPPPHPLLAFQLLCQSFLVVAGATGHSNRVWEELASDPDGVDCSAGAARYETSVRKPRVWFSPAVEAIREYDGEFESYWEKLATDSRWPASAVGIRELWRALTSTASLSPADWRALVENADVGFEAAIAAGCL